MKLLNLVAFLIVCYHSYAQNKLNEHGLKYGHWNENGIDCYYKIISFSYYDTVGFDLDSRLDIRRYDGMDTTLETIRVSGFFGDSISVRDGVMKAYDSFGNLSQIIEYRVGLVGTMIMFSNGDTTTYNHVFLDNISANFYDDYLNNRAFCRQFFKSNVLTYSYYPYDDLIISNALLFSEIDLTKTSSDTVQVLLSAHKNLLVKAIESDKNTTVLDEKNQPLKFPLSIKRNEVATLKIINYQSQDSTNLRAVIRVNTTPGDKCYWIFLSTVAYHLSKSNISATKKITLSREKDKYLIVHSCGPYGHMFITDGGSKIGEYRFEGNHTYKIPLKDLPKEKYEIEIGMCYDDDIGIGGKIDLLLKQ